MIDQVDTSQSINKMQNLCVFLRFNFCSTTSTNINFFSLIRTYISKTLEKTEWTIQRHWQHWVHKIQDENKQNRKYNTICVVHHYTQTYTNNVNN